MWHGAEVSAERLEGAGRVTVVADREGDIYNFIVRRPPEVELLLRSAQDRGLADGTLLVASVASWPEQGRSVIAAPPRIKRAGKTAAARRKDLLGHEGSDTIPPMATWTKCPCTNASPH